MKFTYLKPFDPWNNWILITKSAVIKFRVQKNISKWFYQFPEHLKGHGSHGVKNHLNNRYFNGLLSHDIFLSWTFIKLRYIWTINNSSQLCGILPLKWQITAAVYIFLLSFSLHGTNLHALRLYYFFTLK